ncbi:MAG: alanine dehydrogenase [Anaeromicrobium sp.]|jgi:alanine dehydrogenase|uniref:alanine dehydrogenase n=1 Tax=Anaeromicrobium sp. TaxID=1929132 RepID=UPI0025E7ABFC|nr:alanine dehydrogenase [Anaeromicrobium sp.]MCT4592929.1 alanine dehydrogenase [Anaeromicrobium sp.]
MIIGIPKEIKNNEYRVATTPDGVNQFVKSGHRVLIEKNAGVGSGYSDEDYIKVGAIISTAEEVYKSSDIIYKVKEILPPEYKYMREDLIIFTYLHSNANREMTEVLLKEKVIGISYEDIEDGKGGFPLLKPMSELAGKGGFIAALNYAQSINGGSGILLARVHGVKTPLVTIIGAGAAGIGAAELASSFGNKVSLLDIDLNRLEEAKYKLPPNVELLYSDRGNLEKCLRESDAIINCLLWPKTRKDHLIYADDLKLMKKGAVISDVSCDEGGAIETCKATSHDNPIYKHTGIVHYAVDNIPSAFSRTATTSLSNVTLPFALSIAANGVDNALINNDSLRKGLSFYKGNLTLKETSIKLDLPYTSPEEVLNIV